MAEKVGTMSTALSPVEDRKQYNLVDGRRRAVHLVGIAADPLEDLVAAGASPWSAQRSFLHRLGGSLSLSARRFGIGHNQIGFPNPNTLQAPLSSLADAVFVCIYTEFVPDYSLRERGTPIRELLGTHEKSSFETKEPLFTENPICPKDFDNRQSAGHM